MQNCDLVSPLPYIDTTPLDNRLTVNMAWFPVVQRYGQFNDANLWPDTNL